MQGDTAVRKYTDQIARVEEKLEQQRQRLRNLKAQETKQQRKDDTRRKILYGAAFLALMNDRDEGVRLKSFEKIHQYVRNPKDRNFLGIDEQKDGSEQVEENRSADRPETPDNLASSVKPHQALLLNEKFFET